MSLCRTDAIGVLFMATVVLTRASPGALPITLGARPRLFLDEALVDTTEGLAQVVQQPAVHAASPVLEPTEPWEHRRLVYGSVYYVGSLKSSYRDPLEGGKPKRSHVYAWSPDFRDWRRTRKWITVPDADDPRGAEIDGVYGWHHAGMYLGIAEIRRPRTNPGIYWQLMYGHNGEQWIRIRQTFVDTGASSEAWNAMVVKFVSSPPIMLGDRIRFHCSGAETSVGRTTDL